VRGILARALPAALLVALIIGSPAAALDGEYDGAYGLIATTYGRGSFIVELISGDQARVTTAVKGLSANTEYELILSKARCGVANTPQRQVLRTEFLADTHGASYQVEVVPWLWSLMAPVPRSARIRPIGGGQTICVSAAAFNRLGHSSGGGNIAEMQYARSWDGARRALVILDQLDGDSGRLSWSVSGLGSGTYRLTGATVGCQVAVNAGNQLYSTTFGPDIHGNAVGRKAVAVENDETHWVGSDRIRRIGGDEWACRQAAVTDLVIDPFTGVRP